MALYTGETCLICNNKFDENDDVVACPECGTPYHRSCYKEKKGCINEALHAVHGSWMTENFTKRSAETADVHVCAKCGCPNSPEAQSCRMCGSLLSEKKSEGSSEQNNNAVFSEAPEIDEYFGFDASETMDTDNSITLGEMADYVGSNRFFYMLSFKRLKSAASNISVNLIAFLFPEFYFAGRKMYGWAAVAFAVSFILAVPAMLLEMASEEIKGGFFNNILGIAFQNVMAGFINQLMGSALFDYFKAHPVNMKLVEICRILYIAFQVTAGLAANSLYYRHIIARLKKMRTVTTDANVYRLRLRTEGGVSYISMLVLFLLEILAVFAFAALILSMIYL